METLTDSCGCFVLCIAVSTFLPFVLFSAPNNVCTMFCAATMLCCCHVVLLPCYVVVLGLSLCSVVCLVVMCVLSYIFNPRSPSPQEAFW